LWVRPRPRKANIMTALGPAIHAIRMRLGKTMVQFAELIGCKQSTISRYESGKLIPGRSVLILLLQLAKGAERKPVLDALGVTRQAAAGWQEQDLVKSLRVFEEYLEADRGSRIARSAGPTLAEFARAAKRIVLRGRPVDPALVSILQRWIDHQDSPKAVAYFRDVASYLEVELKVLRGRRSRSARTRS